MNILLTGANGFLGSYIRKEFANQSLTTLGLADCDINCNLAIGIPVLKKSFDLVIHAAGKAHVIPRTSKEKEDFFATNVEGTLNLLYAIVQSGKLPKTIIFISTVSVYGVENAVNFNETAPLLGETPYALSKIKVEELLFEWGKKHNVNIIILRLSLVVGDNPPGTLRTMINGIKKGYYFRIGKGSARRSMVLAIDVAKLITQSSGKSGIYNLTDGYHPSFRELENKIATFYTKKKPFSLPGIAAKIFGFAGDIIGTKFPVNSNKLKKITSTLTFDDTKAKTHLQWKPREVLKDWEIE